MDMYNETLPFSFGWYGQQSREVRQISEGAKEFDHRSMAVSHYLQTCEAKPANIGVFVGLDKNEWNGLPKAGKRLCSVERGC